MSMQAIPAAGIIAEDGWDVETPIPLDTKDFRFWANTRWKFATGNPADPYEYVNWDFELPGGGHSTDYEHTALLEGYKTMLWGMLTNDAFGSRMKPASAGSISSGIREVFWWQVHHGHVDLASLTPQNQTDFVNALPTLLTSREEFYPNFYPRGYEIGHYAKADVLPTIGGSTDGEDDDIGYSYHQVSNRLRIFSFLHAQRALIKKRGIPIFSHAPFSGESYGTVTSKIVPYVINRIPALPEAVALPLLSTVLDWVDRIGPSLAAAHQRFHCAVKGNDSRLLKLAMRQIDALGFDLATLSKLPWRERPEVGLADDSRLTSSHRVRLSALMYRDACVLALEYLVGPRVSEICSAITAQRKENGLPSCIYERESPDGHFDLYFLRGRVTKGVPRPIDHDWVVGLVPRGSKELPMVVRALVHLHTIWSPLNSPFGEYPLFQHFSNGNGMPTNPQNVVRANGMALQRGIRRFIRCFVDLSGLPDFDAHGNNLARYRESAGQCIRNHQGRKTFAEYVLRTRDSALEALSTHYAHFNVAVTYKGYYEPIQRQASELDDMALSSTVNFFVSRAQGKPVFGNMAPEIEAFVFDNGLSDIKDIEVLRETVTDLVRVHNIRIFFARHGACFISAAPLKSRCRESGGQVSFMFNTPDYARRTIEMCCGCDCLAVDATHLPYYENRMEANRKAAADPSNRVAVVRFQSSVRIVNAIRKKIGARVESN